MQDAAAVAVISERFVRSKQSRYPAAGQQQTRRSKVTLPIGVTPPSCGMAVQVDLQLLDAEAACTCVGGIELAAGIPPSRAAAVVGRAWAAAVCQDLGVHCQNVRHCSQ